MGFLLSMTTKNQFFLIKGTKRFFIHEDGYVFKTDKGKDIPIPLNIIKGIPRVRVENEKLNLILLMLEYFGTNIKEFKKYSYKVKNGKIPIDCINIKSIDEFSSLDEQNIFVYKCREKANSHNNRVKHLNKITMYDVLNCLKRFDFTCFYCGGKISSKLWHLDHVHPISKGGLNSNNNIASSCKECNLMKGAIGINAFVDRCKKISKRF